ALPEAPGAYRAVHVAPADAVPEAAGSFHAVLANSVLEHISDVEPVLAEARRLLRPGGVAVVTVPGPGFHEALRGPGAIGRIATGARDRAGYLARLDARLAHERYWDEEAWADALRRAGLTLRRVVPYMSVLETRRWELASNLTGG